MKIIWLASYPKSGNTFIRMLLHTYISGKLQDSKVIGENIPDLHQLLSHKKKLDDNKDKQTIIKTHFCFSENHPYAEETNGFIYILRNPRDVMLSNARYLGEDQTLDNLRNFCITFINNFGVIRWSQMNMGTWPQHVASWLKLVPRLPHIFIKYEDLRMDTEKTLKRVVNPLGEKPEDSRIQMAVKYCCIEKARLFEKKEKSEGRKNIFVDLPNNTPFVGDGKIAQSLAFVGEDIEALYNEKLGTFVNIFGY